MSALALIRPDLLAIQPYDIKHEDLDCPLHANELPWSPLTLAGVTLNRYPTSAPKNQLRQLLADYYQIKAEELLLTRGSDDGIDLLMRLFLRAGIDSILQCPPTFSMYAFYACLQQAGVINCPLQENDQGFSMDLNALDTLWQPNCKLIMICRPNNPTGELIDLATIARLCAHYVNRAVIVVDEAYIEFATALSAASLIPQFDNLVVLRTLSKAYGLAGLRIGAVISQTPLIEALRKVTAPFTLSSAVVALAIEALQDKTWFVNSQQCISQLRAQLALSLQQCAWIEHVYPSSSNFLLIKTRQAAGLADWLLQHDIAIRAFTTSPLQQHLRITVGNEEQNKKLLTALAAFDGDLA